jgi:hypothetical protein
LSLPDVLLVSLLMQILYAFPAQHSPPDKRRIKFRADELVPNLYR